MISPAFWNGRRVLVTGHTGFKGGWLTLWLTELGAEVAGLALLPQGQPVLLDQLDLGGKVRSVIADINDRTALDALIAETRPEIVIHLAAQSLVRQSYRSPVETFATNALGTVQLLDAIRNSPETRAVVVATSDKVYENREWVWGYRESDALGGHDPYSASKAVCELAVAAMRRSFFAPYTAGGHPARIATARAGNVIGGGDWSADRLVPDIVRGCLGPDAVAEIRNPASVRPWQHVTEPLGFYLGLAERLYRQPDGVDAAWNIGPDPSGSRAVREVARALVAALGRGRVVERPDPCAPHEAGLLFLDASKARAELGWRPRWSFDEAVHLTAEWYAGCHRGADLAALTRSQLALFAQPPGFG